MVKANFSINLAARSRAIVVERHTVQVLFWAVLLRMLFLDIFHKKA
jgi:hypothetical protein